MISTPTRYDNNSNDVFSTSSTSNKMNSSNEFQTQHSSFPTTPKHNNSLPNINTKLRSQSKNMFSNSPKTQQHSPIEKLWRSLNSLDNSPLQRNSNYNINEPFSNNNNNSSNNSMSCDTPISPPLSPIVKNDDSEYQQTQSSSNLSLDYDNDYNSNNNNSIITSNQVPISSSSLTQSSVSYSQMESTENDNQNQSNFDSVMRIFKRAWVQQQQINATNMKMNCINFFTNWANVIRTNKLQDKCNTFEVEIKEGKKTINSLQGRVSEQEDVIGDLQGNVSSLESDLEQHKKQLEEESAKYFHSLQELRNVMKQHEKEISELEQRRLRQDLLLDGIIVTGSFILSNLSLVSVPMNLITRLIFQSRSKQRWMRQFLKLFLIIGIVLKVRKQAMQMGIHGKVGSMAHYSWWLLCFIYSRTYRYFTP